MRIRPFRMPFQNTLVGLVGMVVADMSCAHPEGLRALTHGARR